MLIAICISSLEKRLFCSFLNGVVCFLLLSCRSSLYNLDSNPLSDTWLQLFSSILQVTFHCVRCVWCIEAVNFDAPCALLSFCFWFPCLLGDVGCGKGGLPHSSNGRGLEGCCWKAANSYLKKTLGWVSRMPPLSDSGAVRVQKCFSNNWTLRWPLFSFGVALVGAGVRTIITNPIVLGLNECVQGPLLMDLCAWETNKQRSP